MYTYKIKSLPNTTLKLNSYVTRYDKEITTDENGEFTFTDNKRFKHLNVNGIELCRINFKIPFEEGAVLKNPGEYGFGNAIMNEAAAKCGLTLMENGEDPKHENFGSYQDEFGNVFVCVPAFYYKIDTNNKIKELDNQPSIYISYTYKEGYEIPYGFWKSDGSVVPCVFTAKYKAGRKDLKMNPEMVYSAKNYYYFNPLYYENDLNPRATSEMYNTTINVYDYAKKMGKGNYLLHYFPLRWVYAIIGMAHIQECLRKYKSTSNIPKDLCGYANISPYFPKSLVYKRKSLEGDLYEYDLITNYFDPELKIEIKERKGWLPIKKLAGSSKDLCKTSHNGQICGIQDLNSFYMELDHGTLCKNNIIYCLKGIDYCKKLNKYSYYNKDLYYEISVEESLCDDIYVKTSESFFDEKNSNDGFINNNLLIPKKAFSIVDNSNSFLEDRIHTEGVDLGADVAVIALNEYNTDIMPSLNWGTYSYDESSSVLEFNYEFGMNIGDGSEKNILIRTFTYPD